MSTLFFTSDWHIGHENIIKYCQRPFASVSAMNEALIENYNRRVSPEDTCYFMGDICMGNKQENLPLFKQLHGTKILVAGNHDAVFRITEREKARLHQDLYLAAGFSAIYDELILKLDELSTTLRLYHFPYQNSDIEDSLSYEIRYQEYRLEDDGLLLLHGHTHQPEKITGPHSIHIGVDAWGFMPVSLGEIRELSKGLTS